MGPNSPDENRRRGTKEDPRVRGIEDDERFRRLDELRGDKTGIKEPRNHSPKPKCEFP